MEKQPVLSFGKAKDLLGPSFFGPEDWQTFLGDSISIADLREGPQFPWSEATLNAPCPFFAGKSVKDTHFAFLGLTTFSGRPFTIVRWHELFNYGNLWGSHFRLDSGASRQKDARKYRRVVTCQPRWYLMPVAPVPGSADKKYEKQAQMLPAGYTVPSAMEELTKLILYYQTHGVDDIAGDHNVRCRDLEIEYCGDLEDGGSWRACVWLSLAKSMLFTHGIGDYEKWPDLRITASRLSDR